MNDLHLLYQLQQSETNIRQKKVRLNEIVEAQKVSDELLAAKQAADGHDENLSGLRAKQTDLSLQIQTIEEKSKESSEKMYSGEISNPKVLDDFQMEIDSLARRKATAEDEALGVLNQIESIQSAKATADAKLASLMEQWKATQISLNAEKQELSADINALLEKRTAQLANVDAGLLAKYHSVGKRMKDRVAITAVKDSSCLACRVKMPPGLISKAHKGELVHCPSCDRMLYPS